MDITTNFQLKRKRGRSRYQMAIPKTDMTPMVDLGFLLISFFIISTELSNPATADLFMPRLEGSPMPLEESGALTFLLTKDNTVYYYSGNWDDAIAQNRVLHTNINNKPELRRLITGKQKVLDQQNLREGRGALMFLIKPAPDANYGNVIDMLDEALIHRVKKYAILPLQPAETEYLLNTRLARP